MILANNNIRGENRATHKGPLWHARGWMKAAEEGGQ